MVKRVVSLNGKLTEEQRMLRYDNYVPKSTGAFLEGDVAIIYAYCVVSNLLLIELKRGRSYNE